MAVWLQGGRRFGGRSSYGGVSDIPITDVSDNGGSRSVERRHQYLRLLVAEASPYARRPRLPAHLQHRRRYRRRTTLMTTTDAAVRTPGDRVFSRQTARVAASAAVAVTAGAAGGHHSTPHPWRGVAAELPAKGKQVRCDISPKTARAVCSSSWYVDHWARRWTASLTRGQCDARPMRGCLASLRRYCVRLITKGWPGLTWVASNNMPRQSPTPTLTGVDV